MHQRNRNLFSFLAVLVTAGLITGIGSIFLVLIDQLDGGPQLVSGDVNGQLSPLVAEPTFNTLGTHAGTVLSVKAAKGAPLIASGGYDNTAQLWDRNSGQSIPLPHDSRVNALAFSESNDLLVTGSSSGDVAVWFTPSGQLSDRAAGESGPVVSIAVSAKGKTVAMGSSQGSLLLWTITAGSNLQRSATLLTAGASVNAVAFHPIDENIMVSGNQDGLIQVWDTAERQPILTLDGGLSEIASLVVSNNGQYVASGSNDNAIRVWDLETGTLRQTLTGHDSLVSAVAFSPDGTLLASSSYDESLKVWAWDRGLVLCTLKGHAGFVYSVDFTDSGNTLVSGGYDSTIKTWDLTANQNQSCLPL